MKKALLILASVATLYASSGDEIFKKSCVACHALKKGDVDMMKMKAPPMEEVSARLKHVFKNDKKTMVAFIQDYIVNPSKEKSKCMPMAVNRFGVMPPIGKSLSKKEREVIANWIYDNFNSTWHQMQKGCKADMKKHMMGKCGNGKCGGGSKCGSK